MCAGLVRKAFPRKSPAVVPGVTRDQAAATLSIGI